MAEKNKLDISEDYLKDINSAIDKKKGDRKSKEWLKASLTDFLKSKLEDLNTGKISTYDCSRILGEMRIYVDNLKQIEKDKIEQSFITKKKMVGELAKNELKYLKESKNESGPSIKDYVQLQGMKKTDKPSDSLVDVYNKLADSDHNYDYAILIKDPSGIKKILSNTIEKTHSGNFVSINYESGDGVNSSRIVKFYEWPRVVKVFIK